MSREIKFRVWGKREQLFVDDGTEYLGSCRGQLEEIDAFSVRRTRIYDDYLSCTRDECATWYEKLRRENYVLQQYTGLRDKGGKEIYEGDILYNPDDNIHYEIKFVSGAFVASHKQYNTLLCDYTVDSFVVGNIFENPELLNK